MPDQPIRTRTHHIQPVFAEADSPPERAIAYIRKVVVPAITLQLIVGIIAGFVILSAATANPVAGWYALVVVAGYSIHHAHAEAFGSLTGVDKDSISRPARTAVFIIGLVYLNVLVLFGTALAYGLHSTGMAALGTAIAFVYPQADRWFAQQNLPLSISGITGLLVLGVLVLDHAIDTVRGQDYPADLLGSFLYDRPRSAS